MTVFLFNQHLKHLGMIYNNHCSEIHKMTSDYRQAINDVIQLINSVEDGDLDYIIFKLEYMLEKNEKYSNT